MKMGLEDRVVSFYLLVMPMSEYNGLVEYRICSGTRLDVFTFWNLILPRGEEGGRHTF